MSEVANALACCRVMCEGSGGTFGSAHLDYDRLV
ncbi:hypothetical protein AWB80_07382 [Caballeronia pedi]|uniref:Uncharacterized protein n=1 Tax=Caballeronia pedi TaxID=1777141 RepID=A0A158DV59_9BURK|nr:hypothetical protein AWB80_07382 [Caballeronia pedi]